MRKVRLTCGGLDRRTVGRVEQLCNLASCWDPRLTFFVRTDGEAEAVVLQRMRDGGASNLIALGEVDCGRWNGPAVLDHGEFESGDVIAIEPAQSAGYVLIRAGDVHQTVFLTNRCNSHCLMCSQPPTQHDDSWLVEEAAIIAAHISGSPRRLGFTGGEPLLLGGQLRTVLEVYSNALPDTQFDVLTNGRLLARGSLADELLKDLDLSVTWLVPLYGYADFLHDYVVQSPGAFDETIDGLLTLQEHKQAVQLRIVLIEPVLAILPELCEFIGRNLPFVREVALMGCEPIGFALANRAACELDIADWQDQLLRSVATLRRSRVPFVLMNLPLCGLPREVWPEATQSISDWKRVFAVECGQCVVKERCAGLFAWHERGWQPTRIRPIAASEEAYEEVRN